MNKKNRDRIPLMNSYNEVILKKNLDIENLKQNEDSEDNEKIYYGTSSNFHKSRLTKIKFRKFNGIQHDNNEKLLLSDT